MTGALDEKQFFLFRAGGFAVSRLRHVQGVRLFSGNHQKRLIDEFHPILHVESHQFHKRLRGVASRRVRMAMRQAVVLDAVPV